MRHSILTASFALLLAACAATPPPTVVNQPPAGCVNGTGTRLATKPTDCVGFGSAYTKNDVDKTGKAYAQQSLWMMNTALRVSGSAQ